jgi:hypothetical protein
LAVFFAINHYARGFREVGAVNKVDHPSVGTGVRRSIQPFEATVTEQVST